MASNPIFSATLQAALLGAISNILAQLIQSYRNQTALEVDWIPVFQFLIFSIISTPPNFIWQNYLESTFPARNRTPPSPPPAATQSQKPAPKKTSPEQQQQPLNIRNTLTKFILDQTLGATLNTLLFSLYIHSIHMAMPHAPRLTSFTKAASYWVSPGVIDFSVVDTRLVLQAALAEFWTIVLAGIKLWPAVSLLNYTLVRTVEGRSLVGCVAGLGWGVYMSMMAAQ
ncbi:hypothetical protein E4U17_002351 [Claviceps sp. LM77 group G4]|nr:hypothetical protein E4U17_002351 [Claviceps sp. LM77 group G4]KAG6074725.1 hypothetical protein E4U33_002386 [Claviceps sp. LM78 group G4]KAG6076614.1 hypothetical protein E4U16_002673 [Claviceps sp. LM84 group G4]